MSQYNQGLFHSWVPKPIMLLLIMVISIVLFGVTAVYTSNIPFLVGATGELTEDYMWAYYAGVIGMGLAMPLVIRLKARFRTKEIMVTTLTGMAFLFVVMGNTDQPEIIIGASFLISFLRMVGMMEVILPLMFILSADGNRGRFYAVFYTVVLGITQVSSYYVASLSMEYSWQYAYLLIAAVCLATALICVVFQHNQRFMKKVPLHYIDWLGMLLFVISFMFLGYIFSFGKQQAWFASDKIKWATIAFSVTFLLFILRMQIIKRPFISLKAFSKSNVRHGMLMLLFLGMYLGTTTLQNIFAVGVLGYNHLSNASLNLMIFPGLLIGAVVSAKWFNQSMHIRMLMFTGFAAYLLYVIVMYFSMVPEFNYASWLLPMFFKGYGMGVLFIVIWYYTFDKLGMTELLSAIGIIVLWRTFITVGIFSALFSWMQYQLQLQSLGNLAVYLDDVTLLSPGSGVNLRSIQINAVLAANKTLYGYIILAGMGVLVYVLFHHFGKIRYRLLRIRIDRAGKLWMSRKNRRRMQKELETGEI